MPISSVKGRITISLNAETVAYLEEQAAARREQGGKVTVSEVVEQHIQAARESYSSTQHFLRLQAQLEGIMAILKPLVETEGAEGQMIQPLLSPGTRHTAETVADHYGLSSTSPQAPGAAHTAVPASTPGLGIAPPLGSVARRGWVAWLWGRV